MPKRVFERMTNWLRKVEACSRANILAHSCPTPALSQNDIYISFNTNAHPNIDLYSSITFNSSASWKDIDLYSSTTLNSSAAWKDIDLYSSTTLNSSATSWKAIDLYSSTTFNSSASIELHSSNPTERYISEDLQEYWSELVFELTDDDMMEMASIMCKGLFVLLLLTSRGYSAEAVETGDPSETESNRVNENLMSQVVDPSIPPRFNFTDDILAGMY